MGRGEISIEKATINDKPIYVCVFRNTIGKTLYQGRINLISRKKPLTDKATKIQLKVRFISLLKDPISGKFKPEDCVITFVRNHEEQLKFEKVFDEAIEDQKQ